MLLHQSSQLGDSIPTSNLTCRKEVAIRTTFCIAGIIYYIYTLVNDINVPVTKMFSTNVFNELCVRITLLTSIPKKHLTVCNAVYFRLCINLTHITQPVTAEGYDGFHHPRYAE